MSDISGYTPGNYTSVDHEQISNTAAYLNGDGSINYDAILQDIIDNDETYANREDLFSFYILNQQDLPDELLDPALGLHEDDELVETANQWRQNILVDQEVYEELYNDLLTFLGETNVDVSLATDMGDFVTEWYQRHGNLDPGSPAAADGLEPPVVLTDMMQIALQFGNPGLVLLFYVMGSTTILEGDTDLVDETVDNLANQNSTDNTTTSAGASASSGSDVVASPFGDEGANVLIENVYGEIEDVDLAPGQTLVTKNVGLGEVVQGLQEEVLNEMDDIYADIEDWTDDLSRLDPQTDQAELEELRTRISTAQGIARTHTQLLEMSQNLIDSILEAASRLTERQYRTIGMITQSI